MFTSEVPKVRVLAYYLPQFHPIPENDNWWGPGFTEWTNVGKAKKLYPGHYQPKVPRDLGYYDLRVPETRIHQAELAKEAGIEGFLYWHYWFGHGKKLLDRPFSEVLLSGEPDYPFALAWANEDWKGLAHGLRNREVLIKQDYPGAQDIISHFYDVLPAFKDKRYVTVNGKPIFMIYKPELVPDIKEFLSTWQELAVENGLNGISFIAHNNELRMDGEEFFVEKMKAIGFDYVNLARLDQHKVRKNYVIRAFFAVWRTIREKVFPIIHSYQKYSKNFSQEIDRVNCVIPTVIPNWDHTPRSGKQGMVLHGSTPDLFENNVRETVERIKNKKEEERFLFVKSWNEWGEGNYLEPDLKWGKGYLSAIKNVICSNDI